jgi:hypothetical protein
VGPMPLKRGKTDIIGLKISFVSVKLIDVSSKQLVSLDKGKNQQVLAH